MTPDDNSPPMQSLAAGMLLVKRKAGLPHAREDLTSEEVEAQRLKLVALKWFFDAAAVIEIPKYLTKEMEAKGLEFAEMSRYLNAAAIAGSPEEESFLDLMDGSEPARHAWILRQMKSQPRPYGINSAGA